MPENPLANIAEIWFYRAPGAKWQRLGIMPQALYLELPPERRAPLWWRASPHKKAVLRYAATRVMMLVLSLRRGDGSVELDAGCIEVRAPNGFRYAFEAADLASLPFE